MGKLETSPGTSLVGWGLAGNELSGLWSCESPNEGLRTSEGLSSKLIPDLLSPKLKLAELENG